MIERARQIIARGEIAETTYILVFCLVYLMHSIWPARTILWFVLVPVLLLSLAPYRNLLPIVKTSVFVMSAAFLALILATSALAGETPVGIGVAGRDGGYTAKAGDACVLRLLFPDAGPIGTE